MKSSYGFSAEVIPSNPYLGVYVVCICLGFSLL